MTTKPNKAAKLKSTNASQTLYVGLRQKLDDLGYTQFLSSDSVPLVERLLADLVNARDSNVKIKHLNDQLNQEVKSLKEASQKSKSFEQYEHHCRFLEETLMKERKSAAERIQALQVENSKLIDQIRDVEFASDQNVRIIEHLKKENDSKAQLILKLQSHGGTKSGDDRNPSIEKGGELQAADLSKIQSLYKRILSAVDNPAIIDWVKASETKMSCLERDLVNLQKALNASQKACDDYRRQVAEYERKLNKSHSCHDISKLKLRTDKLEKENKDLQRQLTESIRKQHEAMSRAIMLAGRGNHEQANVNNIQLSQLEKKSAALEGERNLMKQLLNCTQKERDDLMKEVQRLHSQEAALMSEIRNLVSESSKSQDSSAGGGSSARSAKSVRFLTSEIGDSGVESVASEPTGVDSLGAGRARENWLRRLTEQRQLYYDNVQQLLDFMKNRRQDPTGALQTPVASTGFPASGEGLQPSQPPSVRETPRRTVQVESQSTQTDPMRVQPAADSAADPTTSTADGEISIPRQFQSWARSLQEDRKSFKEQNEALKSRNQQLTEQVRGMETRLQTLADKLRASEQLNSRLEGEMEAANTQLVATERELTQERAKNQQLRLNMDDLDSNAANLNKKLSEKISAADGARQRCTELEIQVARLEEQVSNLQGQLRSWQVQKSQVDTEQRHLLDDLDGCKGRIAQLEKQLGVKQDTIESLQASLLSSQTASQRHEQESTELRSQWELSRRQQQRLGDELDQLQSENAALKRENERLVSSMASLHVELDRERQGCEDLRREVQTYVSRVRQVETILARKDEERDAMIKQLQQLTNETCSFDAEREKMDRTLRGQLQEASSLQQELSHVRRRLGELEQLYSHQRSCSAEAGAQTEDLMRRLAALERDLRDTREDKARLEQQLVAAQEMQRRLEKQLERLRMEAAQTDSQAHAMGQETTRLHDDIQVLEQRLAQERTSARSLESTVSVLRQERAQQEDQLRMVSQDLTRLQQREMILQEELANSKAELCSNEGKLADLSRELQRLKQDLLQEKFEREKTRQELKRMSTLSRTPPPISPSFCSTGAPLTSRSVTLPVTAATSLSAQSPTKRRPVAARFINSETQT